MSHFNRQSILATFGNLPVAAPGRQVFPLNASAPNARAGELLVISNGTTIDAAGVATATNIQVAVGVGPANGNAVTLRYLAGEDINLCNSTIYATASTPVCGSPQVVDVFVNGCLKANSVYSFAINLDDSFVRSNFQTNERATYPYSIPTILKDCDDCDPCFDSTDFVCKAVDAINGKTQSDPTKVTRFILADLTKQYQPFRAARLFFRKQDNTPNTTRTFCLTVSDGTCDRCSQLQGITGISLDGVVTLFTGTTLATDNTITTHAHIKQLVSELNRVLDPVGGSAYIKHGIGNCCDYTLEINSCINSIELTTGAGPNLIACLESNPFTSFNVDAICRGCGVPPSTISPEDGFRIFLDPIELPCDCTYPPNATVPNTYGRTVDVQAIGDWSCESLLVRESSTQVLPEGFGYFWQDKAHYGNHRGGGGRDFRYNNIHRGKIGLPDEFSRALNSAKGISCEETYCVYNIATTTTQNRFFNNALVNVNTDLDYLLVPRRDTVTTLSWQTMLNALQARGVCSPGDVIC